MNFDRDQVRCERESHALSAHRLSAYRVYTVDEMLGQDASVHVRKCDRQVSALKEWKNLVLDLVAQSLHAQQSSVNSSVSVAPLCPPPPEKKERWIKSSSQQNIVCLY